MSWTVPFTIGLVIFSGTLVLWSLLSGFGCAMNTAGCSRSWFYIDMSVLHIFILPILIGMALMAGGLRKRFRTRNRKD